MSQSLRKTVAALRAQGVTTPELCTRLGLPLDAVMALLLPDQNVEREVAATTSPALRRPVGRPKAQLSDEDLKRILNVLCDRADVPWTLPELAKKIAIAASQSLSVDTVRRELTRYGLTYAEQIRRLSQGTELLEPLVRSKRSLLYVVTHHTTRQLGFTTLPLATVVVGLTPGNRMAFMVRTQSRMTPKFLEEFLGGLTRLHPNRRVVVLTVHPSSRKLVLLRLG